MFSKSKKYLFIIPLLAIIIACNTQRQAEIEADQINEAFMDSLIEHYVERMDSGEAIKETTEEEYKVLEDVESLLVEELEACLKDEAKVDFQEDQESWAVEWERTKDSIQRANKDVIFEDGVEEKEMFLTWNYTYFKQLRIFHLLELRNQLCK